MNDLVCCPRLLWSSLLLGGGTVSLRAKSGFGCGLTDCKLLELIGELPHKELDTGVGKRTRCERIARLGRPALPQGPEEALGGATHFGAMAAGRGNP